MAEPIDDQQFCTGNRIRDILPAFQRQEGIAIPVNNEARHVYGFERIPPSARGGHCGYLPPDPVGMETAVVG